MIMKRRVVVRLPAQPKNPNVTPVTKEEFKALQKQIDQHIRAITKLNDLRKGLSSKHLRDLVDKNIADEEKEIIAINRIQLRRNGFSFIQTPTPLFRKLPDHQGDGNYFWVD